MEEREYEIKKKWDYIMEDPILSISSIKKKAFDGLLADKGLRSLCWKIFLDYIPNLETSSWQIEIDKERQHYEDLKSKFIFDPNKANKEEANWIVNNPLSLEEESPWRQYFENNELQKTIKQDVERTFPDIEFFRSDNIQNILCNILFIYCKLNQDISYRQGMHEILAPILLVVDNDKIDSSSTVINDDLIKNILDSRYVEHDSFFLFCQVMKGAKLWYEYNESISAAVDSTKEKFIVPIVAKCQRIQNEMLKTIDNDLYTALKRNEIEPQLYGLRWLRLLFSREFPIDEVLLLWDGIFAEGNNLELVDWIVLVMLINIRDKIIDQEYSVCLTSLMKYPKLKDDKEIVKFVEKARRLKTNWVEVVSNNQEYHKEHSNTPSHKKSKIQSMLKSTTGDMLSWTAYDPLKLSKNTNKSVSSNHSEDMESNIQYKPSLHEKQLEEENQQLKLKVQDLEELIKKANHQIFKCNELINTIHQHQIEDIQQKENTDTNTSYDIYQEYEQLMTEMKILQMILDRDHRFSHFTTTTSTTSSYSNIIRHKSSSSTKEKVNLTEEQKKPIVEKEATMVSPKKVIQENDTSVISPNKRDFNSISTSQNDTNQKEDTPIPHPLSTSSSLNEASFESKANILSSETQQNEQNNMEANDLSSSPKTNNEEDKSSLEKVNDKDDSKNSLIPTSTFSHPLSPDLVNSKFNESSLPAPSSVINAEAVSMINSPIKEISNKSNDQYSLETYKDDNIWNDTTKTTASPQQDTFDLKFDHQNDFDDIRLQDSSFGFNAFNNPLEASLTHTPHSTTINHPTTDFNAFAIGNPWEDPWNKSNHEPKPYSSQKPFNISSSDTLKAKPNKMISPSSVQFNPFETPITNSNGNVSSNSSTIKIIVDSQSVTPANTNINTNININTNTNTNTNENKLSPPNNTITPYDDKISSNDNKLSPFDSKVSPYDNTKNASQSSLTPTSTSPLTSPKLKTTPPIQKSVSMKNRKVSKSNDSDKLKKRSYSSSYNFSNSLFSPSLLATSTKNTVLERRIEENKKILFSQDDKDSKLGSSSHGLFNDDDDSGDIFEFIKQSKQRNASQRANSTIYSSGYSSYSKSNNTTPLSPTFQSPKILFNRTSESPSMSASKTSKSFDTNIRRFSSSTTKKATHNEYVDYDPLLSPNLKPKKPFSSTTEIMSATATTSTAAAPDEGFSNIVSMTPTLRASTTTTSSSSMTNVNVNAPTMINGYYQNTGQSSSSGGGGGSNGKKEDLGVPIVIEHVQSTPVDSLDTNKNAKPVILDPLGAGVVHSFEF